MLNAATAGWLSGLKVVVTTDHPKMQLSRDCPVGDACRAETNAWMLEFFGTTNTLKDGDILKPSLVPNTIFMNPRTYAQLQAAVQKPEKENTCSTESS